jgi:hypothetical protein
MNPEPTTGCDGELVDGFPFGLPRNGACL